MMDISALLGVERGVTALIGGGGKTTLMYTLAEELRHRGTVVVTTSTHIQRPEQYPVLTAADDVAAALAEHGAVCVASESPEGKLCAPALSFEALAALADFVLVEADGSKRLPLKAHAPHEPVIPVNARRIIYVVGADGFGRPIRQVCHRPERYAALCGAAEDDLVTPALEAKVLHAEGYDTGWVYINKVETAEGWRNAEALAALLPGKVITGSLWERVYRGL
mgnify:FL=1